MTFRIDKPGAVREVKASALEVSASPTPWLDMLRGDDPPRRGDAALLAAYESSPILQSVVSAIADSVADVEWTITEGGEDLPLDDPARVLWERPNSHMTGFAYRRLQVSYRELLGESFAVVAPAPDRGDGVDIELLPFPPTAVSRRGDQWIIRLPDGDEIAFSLEEVFWSRSLSLSDPMGRGRGRGLAVADEIEADEYAARFDKSFFYNSGRPDFMMLLPGANQERIDRFKRQWRRRYSGIDNHHQPAILGKPVNGGASAEIIQLQQKFSEISTSDFRTFQHRIIRRTFGVPPEIVGEIENSNRATITAAEVIMARRVVKPRLRMMREEWQAKVVPLVAGGRDLRLSYVDPEPEDREHKRAIIAEHPYAFSVNEIRAQAGLPPVEGGEIFLRDPAKIAVPVETQGEVEGARAVELPEAEFEVIEREPVVWLVGEKATGDERAAEFVSAVPLEAVDATEAREYYQATLQAWAAQEAAAIGLSVDMAILNPKFVDYAERSAGQLIKTIDGTTQVRLQALIAQSVREGRSPREIQAELKSMFGGIRDWRAETIARTEMLHTVEAGKLETYKASGGLVRQREWVATFDTKVRRAHMRLHGTRVGLNEPFVNPETGGKAPYPGQFPSPEQSCNCRCATVPWIDEMSPAVPDFPPDVMALVEARKDVQTRAKALGRPVEVEARIYKYWAAQQEQMDRTVEGFREIIARRFDAQLDLVLREADKAFGEEGAA